MTGRESDLTARRHQMVAEQIEGRGIGDTAVLQAMRAVPREHFILPQYRPHAYEDSPLPIPAGQTISQPYVVALMISQLDLTANDKVLEVGAGSGYAAALLGQIARVVHTVERSSELVDYARQRLVSLGCDNVHVHLGDGSQGWPDYAPYDAIIVAAGGPKLPSALSHQLALGGRLVMPVGRRRRKQKLICVSRLGVDKFSRVNLGPVAFVPLVGEAGWREEE